ncbi:MAG: DUF547 domain-containing protein [Wenzhouxiangellaceae bacterium]|nr:DUF547 domain-containing protein [Wenzhouxiangellaceae bacterium]
MNAKTENCLHATAARCAQALLLAMFAGLWVPAATLRAADSAIVVPGESQSPALAVIFEPFAQLLDHHLVERRLPSGGLVSAFDYSRALADPGTRYLLQRQRERLAAFDPSTLDSRPRALAFWINAYNVFMIDVLLTEPVDGEPAQSVKDYGSLLNPFALFEQQRFDVGGQLHSLQQIELDILLGETFAERGWKDARVHFMVNCASVGCPALRRELYTAANVDAYMAENTRLALDTPLHLRLDGANLRVTSLFDWYSDDFTDESGSIEAWIRAHGSAESRQAAAASQRIRFIDYDWRLNSPANVFGTE